MALCVGCQLVEIDDCHGERKYCNVCHAMMLAELPGPKRCTACHCPVDELKLIEKRICGNVYCEACFELFMALHDKKWWMNFMGMNEGE